MASALTRRRVFQRQFAMVDQVLADAMEAQLQLEPQPEPEALEQEVSRTSLPDGWGAKFSQKRQRWYIYSLDNPRDSLWKPSGWLPPPGYCEAGGEEPAHQQAESATLQLQAHRRIVVVRHGYRLDEADSRWPERALRPQDSPLATVGQQQAAALGSALAARQHDDPSVLPIIKVLASPFARTVQTAATLAAELRLGASCLGIEEGLSEEAMHMARNKLCTEPWFLPPADLCVAAAAVGGVDHKYSSKVPVAYTRGSQYPGRPLELPAVRSSVRQQHQRGEEASCDQSIGTDDDVKELQMSEQSQVQHQQRIFCDRVARVAADVATAPEWVRVPQQTLHREYQSGDWTADPRVPCAS